MISSVMLLLKAVQAEPAGSISAVLILVISLAIFLETFLAEDAAGAQLITVP